MYDFKLTKIQVITMIRAMEIATSEEKITEIIKLMNFFEAVLDGAEISRLD